MLVKDGEKVDVGKGRGKADVGKGRGKSRCR